MSHAATVRVGDHEVSLSNLDKVLYPESRTTKGDVIGYYAAIAPVMLPHLAGRCITLKRFPDGVTTDGFFEKRCPGHRPVFVGTHTGPGDRRGDVQYCAIDTPAALVWAANMAALELHVPMALAADLDSPQALVFDFDPGAPATIVQCCEVALWVRDLLAAVGLAAWAKTSGSKGLQVYVPLNGPNTHAHTADVALAVGQMLERQHPDRVTTTMAKAVRPGKIFIDWSQNARHKTTIGVYSLRARPQPTVSTPVTWDEVSACAAGELELRFTWERVLERVDQHGDLWADVRTRHQSLPAA